MSVWKLFVYGSGLGVVFAVLAATCAPQATMLPAGDAVAGQATFNARCAQCHTAASLRGDTNLITNNLGTLNPLMIGITLTDEEVANLRAFIATQ